jgi:Tfp pilus assembly protein PilN
LPSSSRAPNPKTRLIAASVAGAAALILLLAIPTVARQHATSHQRHLLTEQTLRNNSLQAQIGDLSSAQAKQDQLDALRQQITALVGVDVSWSRMLQDIARTIPNDVWLTSFQGVVTPTVATAPTTTTTVPGAPTTAPTTTAAGATPTTVPQASAGALTGTVNFSAVGLDYPSVAAWLKMISQLPSLSDLWVPNITRATLGGRDVVNFTSSATLTPQARSNRLERYAAGSKL